jgi:CheY-like chemotaxis protein
VRKSDHVGLSGGCQAHIFPQLRTPLHIFSTTRSKNRDKAIGLLTVIMHPGRTRPECGGVEMKAVVADDDRVAAEILSRTLQRWDFDVTVAFDGEQAWRRIQAAEGPTLVILDWMMPHLNGPDVCRRVRDQLPHVSVYVILLTALESRRDMVAGLTAGADDYVVKPFDHDELRARVMVGVRVLTLQERLADRVTQLEAALSNVKQLRGLVPICSYCKRIRGDDQYWQQVESYITNHSDAQFSHGICPACFETVSEQFGR